MRKDHIFSFSHHSLLCFCFSCFFFFEFFAFFFFFFGLFLLLLLLFFANALCLFRTFQHFKLSLSLSLTVCFVCVCCIISLNRMCVSLVKECSKCDPENSDYNSQRVHYVIWPCWTAMPFHLVHQPCLSLSLSLFETLNYSIYQNWRRKLSNFTGLSKDSSASYAIETHYGKFVSLILFFFSFFFFFHKVIDTV